MRATDVAIPVTNYEHEDELNDKKREIFILKKYILPYIIYTIIQITVILFLYV